MSELVSVIMPVYNVERFLKKSLTSILNQTYNNLEIILVDDGSPDNSGKICDKFAEKDERIVVIHKKNGGVSSARNEGLKVAKGKYVTFADSDDWLADNAVELMVKKIESDDSDFCMGSYVMIGATRNSEASIKDDCTFSVNQSEKLTHYIQKLRSPWCKLFKKEIIKEHGIEFPLGITYGEDAIFVWRYASHCKRFSVIKDVVYYYSMLNLNNACSKYYADVNNWMMMWLENCDHILLKSNLPENEIRAICGNIGTQQCYDCCWQYVNRLSDDIEASIRKIKETVQIFEKYLDLYVEGEEKLSSFARAASDNDYEGIYGMINEEISKPTRSNPLRGFLVKIKQIQIYHA